MIPYENLARLNEPFFLEYEKAFKAVLEGGWYVLGESVREFEASFSRFVGVDHCAGVANGLDALILSLKALELPLGSEVIVPSNTYIATILAIFQAGLEPVLIEPDPRTYNIDPAQISRKISAKTKAIMVVHLYGKCCEMDPITQLCSEHGLFLIEDCAQAHGATYKGRMAGSFGDFGCFSFYPTKNLGALGDGGAVVCRDAQLDERVRMLRNYGSSKKYYNDVVGFNSRLDEVQAAFLTIKLKHLSKITTHKRELAALYDNGLSDVFVKPVVDADFFDVYHIYNICHPQRDRLKQFLLENGIGSEIHYPLPPHRQRAMQGLLSGEYPIADVIHQTTLSLPISYFHTCEDIRHVCNVANEFVSLHS
ncbi:DegT/DnrJ/EryC1/StrS family aminotransferase [Metapseudomonas otitidis]|uniref:DegT/DnrJ/EryC1/StrS family aminotransferase n=1 Tax=Metapseudomonas otitidis TaxID=319939 RepID=A0ABU3XND8_9GAMM|nr:MULTISPECIES: DegT/DnrJ/EryC1/StrS family aminotransferase [Pseudomonas]MDG9781551.1 DegT/DnrJ/EryC1/StrS family aminotransferase [Pseudomonas otitidis]MDL5591660.1 DegT/DnrJ/EryC1/StrS family aminotransferase [Bacillus subtilis]MDV3439447.1 DegT/DnrJ/EryC1/StrS family aminotransferase [Pseudomonas otitidis]MEE1896185.1 DegT/DnrJ/EryC1/StrS family aminotransferase [Pseudomonas otitidis]